MLKKICFFILVLLLLPVSQAYPWGAVNLISPTHQIILTEAYKHLSKDPAFKRSGFLPLANILAQEGVNAAPDPFLDPYTWGPGPDVDGASPYQYHYYNPITKEGMADFAVNLYYKQLIDPNNSSDKSKAAAWSAHFLADMSVPYHIVGMTSDAAAAYKNEKIGELSEEITGPPSLYDNNAAGLQPPVGWGGKNDLGKNDFSNAIANFVDDHSGGKVDWFDPWYSNGSGLLRNSHEVATSSHVLWEGATHKKYLKNPSACMPDGFEWYNPDWKNAAPNFNFNTSVTIAQADQSIYFTREVASLTRQYIKSFHKYPQLGIHHATRNVATLWRASITALRPTIHYTSPNDQENASTLECLVQNTADAIADNVRVKLFIFLNQKLIYEQVRQLESVFAGGVGSAKFKLLLKPETEYGIAMAVAARYDIPDLQYATTRRIIKTNPAKKKPLVKREPKPAERKKPVKDITGVWKNKVGNEWEHFRVVHVENNYYELYLLKIIQENKRFGNTGDIGAKLWRIGTSNRFNVQGLLRREDRTEEKWVDWPIMVYFPKTDKLGTAVRAR